MSDKLCSQLITCGACALCGSCSGIQILELGRRLLRLLALCLDLPPAWFLDRFLKPIAILRPLHYSPKLSRPEEVCFRIASGSVCGRLLYPRFAKDSSKGL